MKKVVKKDRLYFCKATIKGEDRLFLQVGGNAGVSYIDFAFDFGLYSKSKMKYLWGLSGLLHKNGRGGFINLLSKAKETDRNSKQAVLPDGVIYGVLSRYISRYEVKDGRLIYTIEMKGEGCFGSAYFDFGKAHRGRKEEIRKALGTMDEYLLSFLQAVEDVRHQNIWAKLCK